MIFLIFSAPNKAKCAPFLDAQGEPSDFFLAKLGILSQRGGGTCIYTAANFVRNGPTKAILGVGYCTYGVGWLP